MCAFVRLPEAASPNANDFNHATSTTHECVGRRPFFLHKSIFFPYIFFFYAQTVFSFLKALSEKKIHIIRHI